MSDGEVTRFVPLTLEASEQRVTESSLEEPATGMGFRRRKRQAANQRISALRASGHDGGSLHVGQIFDLSFHSHAGGLHRTRDADVIAVSSN